MAVQAQPAQFTAQVVVELSAEDLADHGVAAATQLAPTVAQAVADLLPGVTVAVTMEAAGGATATAPAS